MGWGMLPPVFGLWLIILIAWSLVWKGLALWRAAERGETVWFIVFLLVNTAGILEIVYLFFIAKDKKLRSALGMKTE
jgi:methionyl-tRNA synthetase